MSGQAALTAMSRDVWQKCQDTPDGIREYRLVKRAVRSLGEEMTEQTLIAAIEKKKAEAIAYLQETRGVGAGPGVIFCYGDEYVACNAEMMKALGYHLEDGMWEGGKRPRTRAEADAAFNGAT